MVFQAEVFRTTVPWVTSWSPQWIINMLIQALNFVNDHLDVFLDLLVLYLHISLKINCGPNSEMTVSVFLRFLCLHISLILHFNGYARNTVVGLKTQQILLLPLEVLINQLVKPRIVQVLKLGSELPNDVCRAIFLWIIIAFKHRTLIGFLLNLSWKLLGIYLHIGFFLLLTLSSGIDLILHFKITVSGTVIVGEMSGVFNWYWMAIVGGLKH